MYREDGLVRARSCERKEEGAGHQRVKEEGGEDVQGGDVRVDELRCGRGCSSKVAVP
jgi:hypothetical protein